MKKYYVKGGILVDTPFFKYENAGAGYGSIPGNDVEIITTNRELPTGEKYLLIDDCNPKSIFAEYYASSWFTMGYCWAPMFHKTYKDDYTEFCDRIKEARILMLTRKRSSENEIKALLSRHSFFTILCALETFIADTVLTRITNDEATFYHFARQIKNYEGCEKDIELGMNGLAEQKVIEYVLHLPYLKSKTIKRTYKSLFGFTVDVNADMEGLFKQRNRIAHRGGRMKDGSYVSYSDAELETTILKVDSFVLGILKEIHEWESKRNE